MIIIYHNPRCTTSRKALELLESKNIDFEVVDYLKNPLKKQELAKLLENLGMTAQELIRKKDKTYIEAYKDKDLRDIDYLEAMIEHPRLMERPIVANGKKAVVGRPVEKILEII